MSLKTRAILVIAIGTILGVSLSLGGAYVPPQSSDDAYSLSRDQALLFAEVIERVKSDYVEPLDDEVLLDSAIRGMVSELDAHSEYLDANEYRDIRISTTGSYSGVGLEVSTADGRIIVVTPIDDSPARKAGVQAGDNIIAINGATVEDNGLDDTIRRMRGRAGSKVSITILRGEEEEVHVFSMRRETIKVASVRHEMLAPAAGYARISQFTETTAAELSRAIDAMNDQSQRDVGSMLTGLILDLRNNPGGILEAAVDVSDLFMDDGVIVSADGRTQESRFTRKARRGDILDGATIVLLVNKGSASASEIVAGALQDHNRALIIGTSTFGKGLVQTVTPLSKGRAIKLTTSRYFTPSGESINDVGVSPDVIVESAPGYPGLSISVGPDLENDEQLNEALSFLTSKRVLHSSVN